MRKVFMVLAVATCLVGCRTNRESGGTGTPSIDEHGSGTSMQTNSLPNDNLPGGDVRPNTNDGTAPDGTTP